MTIDICIKKYLLFLGYGYAPGPQPQPPKQELPPIPPSYSQHA